MTRRQSSLDPMLPWLNRPNRPSRRPERSHFCLVDCEMPRMTAHQQVPESRPLTAGIQLLVKRVTRSTALTRDQAGLRHRSRFTTPC
jgi:hypothetical protein